MAQLNITRNLAILGKETYEKLLHSDVPAKLVFIAAEQQKLLAA